MYIYTTTAVSSRVQSRILQMLEAFTDYFVSIRWFYKII